MKTEKMKIIVAVFVAAFFLTPMIAIDGDAAEKPESWSTGYSYESNELTFDEYKKLNKYADANKHSGTIWGYMGIFEKRDTFASISQFDIKYLYSKGIGVSYDNYELKSTFSEKTTYKFSTEFTGNSSKSFIEHKYIFDEIGDSIIQNDSKISIVGEYSHARLNNFTTKYAEVGDKLVTVEYEEHECRIYYFKAEITYTFDDNGKEKTTKFNYEYVSTENGIYNSGGFIKDIKDLVDGDITFTTYSNSRTDFESIDGHYIYTNKVVDYEEGRDPILFLGYNTLNKQTYEILGNGPDEEILFDTSVIDFTDTDEALEYIKSKGKLGETYSSASSVSSDVLSFVESHQMPDAAQQLISLMLIFIGFLVIVVVIVGIVAIVRRMKK